MKLQILSDGSMVLDGDAAGLAEFAKAMRVTTTVATSVDTTVATTVATTVESNLAPKPTPRVRAIPTDPIPSIVPTSDASSRLLSAMSSEEGRTLAAIADASGLGTVQARNLLNRLRERGHVVSDGGSPELWLRAVNVKFAQAVKPESTLATKTSAAKGTNTKFILDLCTDWTRRTVILSRATAAGLNANSIGVQLPILADRGWLEGRTAEDGRVEYRTKPADSTVP